MADKLEPGLLTAEGHAYLLKVFLMGAKPPENLWVGLCKRPPGAAVDLKALSRLEPKAGGYKRIKLSPSEWRLEEDNAVSKQMVFSNFTGDVWTPVDVNFIATSEDDAGILLFWGYLKTTRTLMPGDELWFPCRIGLLGKADVRV